MHEEDKVWILQSPKFPRISHSTRRVTQCRYFSLLHSYMTPAPEANLWIAIFFTGAQRYIYKLVSVIQWED